MPQWVVCHAKTVARNAAHARLRVPKARRYRTTQPACWVWTPTTPEKTNSTAAGTSAKSHRGGRSKITPALIACGGFHQVSPTLWPGGPIGFLVMKMLGHNVVTGTPDVGETGNKTCARGWLTTLASHRGLVTEGWSPRAGHRGLVAMGGHRGLVEVRLAEGR